MKSTRIILLWAAGIFACLALALELGSHAVVSLVDASAAEGLSMPAMGLIDGLLLWLLLTLVTSTIIPAPVHNKLRALLTPLVYLVAVIVAVFVFFGGVLKLTLMLSLLLAVPFGPLVYLSVYGNFGTDGVTLVTGIVTGFRAAVLVILCISSWRYLKNKTLISMATAGFISGFLVGLIFALLPGILHSVGDAVLAIIFAVLASVMSIVMFVRSIPALLSAFRI